MIKYKKVQNTGDFMSVNKTIDLYNSDYEGYYKNKRISARGIVIKDNKVLLLHEFKDGTFLSPGGGVEENETLEECCKRELLEETGYIVDVCEHFLTVNEYIDTRLFVGNYFLCEIKGSGEPHLTETEKEHKAVAEWVDIDEALEIFKTYKGLAKVDEGKISLYRRELTVLKLLNP